MPIVTDRGRDGGGLWRFELEFGVTLEGGVCELVMSVVGRWWVGGEEGEGCWNQL
jgi:hypothetical protein